MAEGIKDRLNKIVKDIETTNEMVRECLEVFQDLYDEFGIYPCADPKEYISLPSYIYGTGYEFINIFPLPPKGKYLIGPRATYPHYISRSDRRDGSPYGTYEFAHMMQLPHNRINISIGAGNESDKMLGFILEKIIPRIQFIGDTYGQKNIIKVCSVLGGEYSQKWGKFKVVDHILTQQLFHFEGPSKHQDPFIQVSISNTEYRRKKIWTALDHLNVFKKMADFITSPRSPLSIRE